MVLATAFGAAAVPVDQLAARLVAGTDLRRHRGGTVSGSALFEVAGFPTLAVAGCLDLAQGALGPLLAGRHRPYLTAASVLAAVVAHNWSPLLRGAGGRGVSTSLGALAVAAPEGVAVLGSALGLGRLLGHSGLATLLGAGALLPVLARRRGPGLALAAAMVGPMLVKRALGNNHHWPTSSASWVERLLFDREAEVVSP